MTLLLNAHPLDRQSVILNCAKSKGARFEDVVLRLDNEKRWFRLTDEAPPRTVANYEKLLAAVRSHGTTIRRNDLDELLLPQMSKATITRLWKEALRLGDLVQSKVGHYCAPNHDQMISPIDIDQVSNQTIEDHEEVLN